MIAGETRERARDVGDGELRGPRPRALEGDAGVLPQVGGDGGEQAPRIDGLHDMAVHPGREAALEIFAGHARRERDDGSPLPLAAAGRSLVFERTDLPCRLVTVDLRELAVHENEVVV